MPHPNRNAHPRFFIRPLVLVTVLAAAAVAFGCATGGDLRFGTDPDDPGGNPHPGTYGPDTMMVAEMAKAPTGERFTIFLQEVLGDGRPLVLVQNEL